MFIKRKLYTICAQKHANLSTYQCCKGGGGVGFNIAKCSIARGIPLVSVFEMFVEMCLL